MKSLRNLLALAAIAVAVATPPAFAAEEVNLYSARKEELIKPLLDRFTDATGIEVNLVTGKADALLKRLETEGRNTPADLLVTVDAGRLHRAVVADLLQPVESDVLAERIPSAYRHPENQWFGLSIRSRVMMYAKDRVDPSELSTYEDLADPKWKGRICIRSSSNIYNQSLVASLIAVHGEELTERWAEGLVANMARPPSGGDRDQIKAVAAGQCDVAVANTYYLGTMLTSSDPAQREAAAEVAVFWPNQDGRGAHVNISGAGVTKYARNRDNAVKLLEFLVSDSSQQWYAEANSEYPAVSGVPLSDTLQAWGHFRADDLNLAVLGRNNAAAVKLMDRAGWK
ncbi:MAG: Fe(3+) ABC transporter substrate-binding protein [Gammaproteobacteria bacterium]|nr:Fe(3+) ABC transporter substrate-binding protein [Gammaproteobacteria bacterium]